MIKSLLAIALSCAATLGVAAPQAFDVDAAQSHINFSVSQFGLWTLSGLFHDFVMDFRYDADDPNNSALTLTIQAASVDVSDADLNAELLGKDYFDCENFPALVFRSTKVEQTDEHRARVQGEFTMLGVTKPVIFEVAIDRDAAGGDELGRVHMSFEAAGQLDRTEFGMTHAVPFIGRTIDVRLSVQGWLARDLPSTAPSEARAAR